MLDGIGCFMDFLGFLDGLMNEYNILVIENFNWDLGLDNFNFFWIEGIIWVYFSL